MKILFICGDYPPNSICATADTSLIMVNALRDAGHEVDVLTNLDWSIFNLFWILRKISSANAKALFMPYATLGYGHSIVPQIIAVLNWRRIVVLIHEVSQVHVLRKLSLLPFSICKFVVFTNYFERNYFHKLYPWTPKVATHVIPIGSNISQSTHFDYVDRSRNRIVYFGMFRPKKGLEEVLELAKLITKKQLPLRVTIVGRIVPHFEDYYFNLRLATNGELSSVIEWEVDASEQRVSQILGSNLFSYLPFPDGASERRGSLFAALAHKMFVITRQGDFTPKNLEDCVFYVNSPEEALSCIQSLAEYNSISYSKLGEKIEHFLYGYSWLNIIPQYCALFEAIDNKSIKI